MPPFCAEGRTNARSQGRLVVGEGREEFSPPTPPTTTTKLKQKNSLSPPTRRTVHKLVQLLPLEPRDVDEVGASQRELAARVTEVRRPVWEDKVVLHFCTVE